MWRRVTTERRHTPVECLESASWWSFSPDRTETNWHKKKSQRVEIKTLRHPKALNQRRRTEAGLRAAFWVTMPKNVYEWMLMFTKVSLALKQKYCPTCCFLLILWKISSEPTGPVPISDFIFLYHVDLVFMWRAADPVPLFCFYNIFILFFNELNICWVTGCLKIRCWKCCGIKWDEKENWW